MVKNKASDTKLVYLYSNIKMMHGPVNLRTLSVICTWTVCIHCTLMWTKLNECVPHVWMTSAKKMTYMMQWGYTSGWPVCLHGMKRDITFTLTVLRQLLSL